MVTVFFSLRVNCSCRSEYTDGTYRCNSSGLTQVPTDIDAEAKKVYLDKNRISDIRSAAFSHLSRCKELSLNNNKLTLIRKGMFQGLESLEELYLQFNDITRIEDAAFSMLRNLTYLGLYGNKLTHIRAATFEGMSELVEVGLGRNEISNIEPGSFTNLLVLFVPANRLTTLERNIFGNEHPTNLTLLISHNPLQCDNKMCWIKQGEEEGWLTLNLTRPHSYWTKPDCENYPDRNWDDITLNCAMEGNFYLDQEKYVYTDGNYRHDGCELTEVPTNIPADARTVYLSDNQISDIRNAGFSQLTNCTELWLNNNTLIQIETADFVGLESLKELILENNFITEIQTAAFFHLEQCSDINIKGNKLTRIHKDMFIGLPFLETLSLSDNKINNIEPGTFVKLSKLMILDLSKNKISNIAPQTFTEQTLSRIHLHGNQLTTLERNVFGSQHPTNLTLLLSDNPVQCDSRICWIKEAERDGWITLNALLPDASWSKPDCVNYPGVDWDNITLSCPAEGNCRILLYLVRPITDKFSPPLFVILV